MNSPHPHLLPLLRWDNPWLAPWRELGCAVAQHLHSGASVHAALNACCGDAALRFVAQSALPKTCPYEVFVFETKTVPTRDNLHDFFNGLAWLRLPQTKAQLCALQYAQLRQQRAQSGRGSTRDALTLFDENAALLCARQHAPVLAALRARDWVGAFQTHRALLTACPPLLFGHALLEKLTRPYKAITAHAFAVSGSRYFCHKQGEHGDCAALDGDLARQIAQQNWDPKPFVPLPVLGVARWCADNEDPDFYADSTVFRPPRT